MRAVDLCPVVKERDDRLLLALKQAVHRVPAGRSVLQTAGGATLAPAPRPGLAELQVRAGPAVLPACRGRRVDQLEHARLGGRVDAARDPATQSQRPFPSASINLTPISLIASESRAISAFAAASSGSGPWPALIPGLDCANASNAPCLATMRSFMIVERSTRQRSAAAAIVYS